MTALEEIIASLAPQDAPARSRARERLGQLTMPYWALGRLMDLAEDLAGMTGSLQPPVTRKTVLVLAADHGIVGQGVSRYPREVTCQMVRNFVRGGAGINVLARRAGAEVIVVDMGVAGDLSDLVEAGRILDRRIAAGTGDMTTGPAMTRDEARRSVEAGMALALSLSDTTDVFATGEMGIGNTAPSSAIVALYSGQAVDRVTGRGTGIDDEGLRRKVAAIETALRINDPDKDDPLDVLAKVGGFEIGGMAGVILGAAARKKPVLIDGFISTAGAIVACRLAPLVLDYLIASHRSLEPGHRIALESLGKLPLLDLDLRLGEGTGSALAMPLVDAAAAILTEVATFAEAGVSRAEP